jgi:hypothetical protein
VVPSSDTEGGRPRNDKSRLPSPDATVPRPGAKRGMEKRKRSGRYETERKKQGESGGTTAPTLTAASKSTAVTPARSHRVTDRPKRSEESAVPLNSAANSDGEYAGFGEEPRALPDGEEETWLGSHFAPPARRVHRSEGYR